MDGQREFPRRDAHVPVRWRRQGEETFIATDIACDISKGGMCLMINEELESEQVLDVEIELSDARVISSTVKVIRCFECGKAHHGVLKRFKAGVEFVSIRDEDGKEIERFVFESFFT